MTNREYLLKSISNLDNEGIYNLLKGNDTKSFPCFIYKEFGDCDKCSALVRFSDEEDDYCIDDERCTKRNVDFLNERSTKENKSRIDEFIETW